ncbi:MAG: hypothetical protein EAZ55_00875 [Cytophagales bacterium]|nr:MAG: hypothetical protein EAZ55_00875 [Cytophagales bacterium]
MKLSKSLKWFLRLWSRKIAIHSITYMIYVSIKIRAFPFYPFNPCSILEHHQIDDLLKAQTERIELLKLHKKGLLQNLFPR